MNVKLNFIGTFLQKFPFSSLFIAFIWVICLIPIPETPLSHVAFADKYTHVLLYAFLSLLLWGEQLFRSPRFSIGHFVLRTTPALVLMGGIIELAQRYCTMGNRSGEWLDFAANSLGVTVGTLIGIGVAWCLSNARKGW